MYKKQKNQHICEMELLFKNSRFQSAGKKGWSAQNVENTKTLFPFVYQDSYKTLEKCVTYC